MLTGMIVLGLVAALGVPLAMMSGGDQAVADTEADDTESGEPTETDEDVDPDEAEAISLGVLDGPRSFGGFRPGTDRLEVTLPDWSVDVFATGGGDEPPGVQFGDAPGSTWVTFPGLGELPEADIFLTVVGADGVPATHSLTELTDEDGAAGEEAILRPVDPDLPDRASGAGSGDGALDPCDADAPDAPPDDPSKGEGLQPVLDDEVMPLSPVVLVSADPAQWPVSVDGFDPGADILYFRLDADQFGHAPDVAVGPCVDGSSGEVRVNGDLIAVLRNAPDATFDDLLVEMVQARAA